MQDTINFDLYGPDAAASLQRALVTIGAHMREQGANVPHELMGDAAAATGAYFGQGVIALRNRAMGVIIMALESAGGQCRVEAEMLDGGRRFAIFSDTTEDGVTVSELLGVLTLFAPDLDGLIAAHKDGVPIPVDFGFRIQYGARLVALADAGIKNRQALQNKASVEIVGSEASNGVN